MVRWPWKELLLINWLPLIDIDECTNTNGNCSQTCTNTNGSYFCSCLSGYQLVSNVTCNGRHNSSVCFTFSYSILLLQFTDINECSANNGNCSQLCNNTVGSYYCSCIPGYQLNITNKICSGELMYCCICINIKVIWIAYNSLYMLIFLIRY